MNFENWKDRPLSDWKYQDILEKSQIEEYKSLHQMLYRTLGLMIHDIAFLAACVDMQDLEVSADWITVKFLHRDVYENLIVRMYRAFFDNSGNDAVSLLRFKNRVISNYVKKEYREQILSCVSRLPIEDRIYRRKKDSIGANILILRDQYIAHGLINPEENCQVDLADLKTLLEYGCELFQTLSFNVKDFYNPMLADGYGFEKEFKFTYKQSCQFIKNMMLTSSNVTSIKCEFDDYCSDEEKKKISGIICEFNDLRKMRYE